MYQKEIKKLGKIQDFDPVLLLTPRNNLCYFQEAFGSTGMSAHASYTVEMEDGELVRNPGNLPPVFVVFKPNTHVDERKMLASVTVFCACHTQNSTLYKSTTSKPDYVSSSQ